MLGDPELLKIAFQNLFINAAQAMDRRGVVRVDISDIEGGQRVVISDTGPGIPSDLRAKLFRPFFTTKARGTGLGLSITKRLIELHGGTIAIDCPPAGGTVVTIELPAAPEKAPQQPSS
jgi:signal transduction histidine kinase